MYSKLFIHIYTTTVFSTTCNTTRKSHVTIKT